MPTTNVTYGHVLGGDTRDQLPVFRAGESENLTPGGSSSATSKRAVKDKFGAYARVTTDTAVYIAIGGEPEAAAGGILMLANDRDYFALQPGERVAVIQASL